MGAVKIMLMFDEYIIDLNPGGAGAQRGTGGLPPPRGAAALRSARTPALPHQGGRRGGAGAGAKKAQDYLGKFERSSCHHSLSQDECMSAATLTAHFLL